MPYPQTAKQQRVEARIKELAASASKRLGVSRRKFLASSGGMAAAFLAMNEAFGAQYFEVDQDEMFEDEAHARNAPPKDLFVFDGQTHLIRSSLNFPNGLRALAQGPGPASAAAGFLTNPYNPGGHPDELGNPWTQWNPALDQLPNTGDELHLVRYIQQLFLESQVTVAVLSANNIALVPQGVGLPRPPRNVTESLKNGIITPEQAVAVRNFVNEVSGSTRLLAHGFLCPGIGNLHDPVYGDFMQWQIERYQPDAWKGYNTYPNAKVDTDPESLMRQWSLDDADVAYPMYEVIVRNNDMLRTHPGFFNICIHKGFQPNLPDDPKGGNPTDVPQAAKDWPELNFIIYHSCMRPMFFMFDALEEVKSGKLLNGVPDISFTSRFVQLAAPYRNAYAEVGTTFASTVITFPTVWAHVIGQMLKFLGEDRILFGGESPIYGSPQWEIEAFWRFQIPEEMRKRWGYPKLTERAKRKILGLNSARLYGVPTSLDEGEGDDEAGLYKPVPANYESLIPASLKKVLEYPGYTADNMSKLRQRFLDLGGLRSNTRYGWIRTRV
jgi:predicted TIM-barrel fold metal-dependent hydrolase